MSGFRVPPGVAWVEVDTRDDAEPEVVVARVPAGPPYALRGPSALIWEAALDGGDEAEVTARVADLSGAPESVVADDVRRTLAELVAMGVLAHD